jgi:hypothetical protein
MAHAGEITGFGGGVSSLLRRSVLRIKTAKDEGSEGQGLNLKWRMGQKGGMAGGESGHSQFLHSAILSSSMPFSLRPPVAQQLGYFAQSV